MKKLLPLFALLGLFVFAIGCDDDDDDDPTGDVTIMEAQNADGEPTYYGKVGGNVTFTGSGFTENTTVSFEDNEATIMEVSDSEISVEIPDVLENSCPENFDVSATNGGNINSFNNFRVFPSNTQFIKDDDVENSSWTSDNLYVLDGYVFVESSLDIEEGTVIMNLQQTTTGDNATSLIITREATINAEGTSNNPIIFTSDADEEPTCGTVNLTGADTKLWAGVILLGNAEIGAESNEVQIEGIPTGEDRALYGGSNNSDNTGTLKYVSIRHTGAEIGPGDEIQGLTLGGVGSATTIEYIDIFASSDDGVEIFGGTVAIKYFSVAYAEDDSYDFDLGWKGYGQYLFALQGAVSDHLGEWDGAIPDDNSIFTTAGIYNATLVGKPSGEDADAQSIIMRDGNAISLYNSLVVDNIRKFIQVEDKNEPFDSYANLLIDGTNEIQGNICFDLNGNSFAESVVPTEGDGITPRDPDASMLIDYLSDPVNDNQFADPGISSISRSVGSGGLNPVATSSVATTGAVTPSLDSGQDDVSFKGAFDPNAGGTFLDEWSTLARYNILQ